MKRLTFLIFLAITSNAFAGEPPAIEGHTGFAEPGLNRDGSLAQVTCFVYGDSSALEITQEWASPSRKHQLSYVLPVFNAESSGPGDVTLNYRYQLFGDGTGTFSSAPRLAMILPTRGRQFGDASSGLEISVPVTASLSDEIQVHVNAGASWIRERDGIELKVAQSVVWAPAPVVEISLETEWTRCGGEDSIATRPGVQFPLAGPGGMQFTPGIAFPLDGSGGVLFYVGLQRTSTR
jgi:hypothetical protein